MRVLIWSAHAEADLYDIAGSVIEQDLDDYILDRIEMAPLSLLDHPYLGEAIGSAGLRKWSVRKTPFILLYLVSTNAIEIIRVIHAATDWRPE